MSEREEFEKWWYKYDATIVGDGTWQSGDYAFDIWQACTECKQQKLDELAAQNAALVLIIEKLKPYIQHNASEEGCTGCNLEGEIKQALPPTPRRLA